MVNPHKSRTLDYLAGLLDIYDSLTEIERNVRWIPEKRILLMLCNKRLKQLDRVAIVIAAYAKDHGGDSPPWAVVGDVLGINKSTAYGYGVRLAGNREHRGAFKHAAFYLTQASYTHPLLTQAFEEDDD